MRLSLAVGFKVFTILFGIGLVGALLAPSPREAPPEASSVAAASTTATPTMTSAEVVAVTGPLTRAILNGIYFDVIRAVGQGDQLQIELRAYNTGVDRDIAPGRVSGVLQPALFATVFDEQGGKWHADQVRIANVTSTQGYLPQSKLVTGIPTSMVLRFERMPAVAGSIQLRTIPRLEVPIVVCIDEPNASDALVGEAAMLVFRQIPVGLGEIVP